MRLSTIKALFSLTPLLVTPACGGDSGITYATDEAQGEALLLGHQPRLGEACDEARDVTRGTCDIAFTNTYTVHSRVLNSSDDLFIARAAQLTIETPVNASFVLPSGDVIISGSVPAGEERVFPVNVLRAEVGDIIAGAPEFVDDTARAFRRGVGVTVLVSLTIVGETASGAPLETNQFTFPLDICAGCLVSFPTDALQSDGDGSSTCDPSLRDAAFEGDRDQPCALGQDEPVDCSTCHSLALSDAAKALCEPDS
jgi:hypothetical protein